MLQDVAHRDDVDRFLIDANRAEIAHIPTDHLYAQRGQSLGDLGASLDGRRGVAVLFRRGQQHARAGADVEPTAFGSISRHGVHDVGPEKAALLRDRPRHSLCCLGCLSAGEDDLLPSLVVISPGELVGARRTGHPADHGREARLVVGAPRPVLVSYETYSIRATDRARPVADPMRVSVLVLHLRQLCTCGLEPVPPGPGTWRHRATTPDGINGPAAAITWAAA